jgi:hypothetical protein
MLIKKKYIGNIMAIFPFFKQFPTRVSNSQICNNSNHLFLHLKKFFIKNVMLLVCDSVLNVVELQRVSATDPMTTPLSSICI